MLISQSHSFNNQIIASFIICMQAPVRDGAIGGSVHGALRTTGIVRVLNKF